MLKFAAIHVPLHEFRKARETLGFEPAARSAADRTGDAANNSGKFVRDTSVLVILVSETLGSHPASASNLEHSQLRDA